MPLSSQALHIGCSPSLSRAHLVLNLKIFLRWKIFPGSFVPNKSAWWYELYVDNVSTLMLSDSFTHFSLATTQSNRSIVYVSSPWLFDQVNFWFLQPRSRRAFSSRADLKASIWDRGCGLPPIFSSWVVSSLKSPITHYPVSIPWFILLIRRNESAFFKVSGIP